jgi:hypothetical protein
MGLNLSLKGQRIVPKITQKREIKCERIENKSIQSIYTLARLASSSSRVRRVGNSTGPTIMDFMQCINFKSRLDREREMIRRKIRSSTLYRKPSFNVFNSNGEVKKNCIAKNIKIDEFKDDPSRKNLKTSFGCDDNENESEKNIGNNFLEITGSKYLDVVTANKFSIDLAPNTSIVKSFSSSSLCFNNNELIDSKASDMDFEKAITQSHLSPSLKQEHNEDDDALCSDEATGEIRSPSLNKRKVHARKIKKSTNLNAVGLGKYSDALTSEVLLDDFSNAPNSMHEKTLNSPDTSKTKKHNRKAKSSHNRNKLDTNAIRHKLQQQDK